MKQHTSKLPINAIWIILGLLIISLSSCEPATSTPPPPSTNAATATLKPTSTLQPSATPQPEATNTPEPPASPTPTPTLKPTSTSIPMPGDAILTESFSADASEDRWDLWEGDNQSFHIEDGKLLASISAADIFNWTETYEEYTDMDLEIEATVLEGGEEAQFGLLFAVSDSGEDFEGCIVQADGSGYCMHLIDDELEFEDWVSVDASDTDVNTLRLVTMGEQWGFYVNGECVGSGESPQVSKGGTIGLVISTEEQPATVAYDDLIIQIPDEDSESLLVCQAVPYFVEEEATEPPPAATAPPATSAPPPRTGGNTFNFVNRTPDQSCHFELWGPASYSVDVQAGQSNVISNVPNGEYGWKTFITGVGESTGNTPANMTTGGQCTFTCSKSDSGYYTNGWCE